MTETEFINKVDWEGGLFEAINYGLTENDLPEDSKLRPIVERAVHGISNYWTAENEYFDYCENCRHEEE